MADMNKVFLTGRIGNEPKLEYTTNGKNVIKFSIAVSVTENNTMWVNCEIWNKEKIMSILKKGRKITIDGSLQIKKWNDKYFTSIAIYQIIACFDSKSDKHSNSLQKEPVSHETPEDETPFFMEDETQEEPIEEEDIPF